MAKGKNISDADRRRARKMLLNESGRTISAADRRFARKMLADESGRIISDSDRLLLEEKYLKRNDGGIAQKTRTF
jgi:hypothetical protein